MNTSLAARQLHSSIQRVTCISQNTLSADIGEAIEQAMCFRQELDNLQHLITVISESCANDEDTDLALSILLGAGALNYAYCDALCSLMERDLYKRMN